MKFYTSLIFFWLALLGLLIPVALPAEAAADFEALFEERIRSVVAVEFFVETEIDRQPASELGIVADDSGLIVLQEHSVPGWVPVEQLKQFKVRLLRGREEFDAVYLGQEPLNRWHFLRVAEEGFHEKVVPVTAWETADPRIGEQLWGFAAMDEDYDFEPYFLAGRFSLLRPLPQAVGFTMVPVTGPGSLVFNLDGALVGWGTLSYLSDALLHVGHERMPVAIQTTRESGMFFPVGEFLPHLDRVPEDPKQQNVPWIGVMRLQPVEKEVAEFLSIDDRGSVILSEILNGSPAAEAGLQKGDVAIAIDGEPIPYYRPQQAVTDHLQREVTRREPGEKIQLTVLRGTEEREHEVEIGIQPPTLRDAEREYFPEIGMTVREFLLFDGFARRVEAESGQGLVVQFVRPNSPAATAGLHPNDWIKEIDGVPVEEYEAAVAVLSQAVGEQRNEIVFLVSRQNETSVLRVRLR